MINSIHLAKLLGPCLIMINVSEAINFQIWTNVSPTQTYLSGALWFVAGLAIIRAHNHWSLDWTVLITLVGWFIILGGLLRMFFPQPIQQDSQNPVAILTIQAIMVAVGMVLTYKAFGPTIKSKMS